MKIKQILLLVTIFTSFFVAEGQENKVEFTVGGGYSIHIPKIKNKTTNDLKGFHAGGLLTYNINELVGIESGVFYNCASAVTMNISQLNLKKSLGTWNQTRTLFSGIDIPLRAVYSYMLADEFYLQLFAGPNFNIGLSKQENFETYVDKKQSSVVQDDNIYNRADYSRFDLQFGVGAGVQWLGIGLRASVDWGLLNRTNISNVVDKANDIKVTLSYKF